MKRVVIRLEQPMIDELQRLREEPRLQVRAHQRRSRSGVVRALLALGIASVKDGRREGSAGGAPSETQDEP
jgi:hypothetical protein